VVREMSSPSQPMSWLTLAQNSKRALDVRRPLRGTQNNHQRETAGCARTGDPRSI